MALPLYTFYIQELSQNEWNAGPTANPRFQTVKEAFDLARVSASLSSSNANIQWGWLGGIDTQMTSLLKLHPAPQLLFAVKKPNGQPNEWLFMAKLVDTQVTRANIELMLNALKRLELKYDPTSGKPSWYDPSLAALLPSLGVSSETDKPGGFMLGLNPDGITVGLNRYGQVLSGIADFLKSNWMLILGGIVAYKISRTSK